MNSFLESMLDILYPRRCVGCQRFDWWLCDDCIAEHRDPQHLQLRNDTFQSVTTVGPYHDPFWRQAITMLKFNRIQPIAKILGDELALELTRVKPIEPVLVPIPLHRKRERERGFNQSALIAREISAQTGWPVAIDWIARIEHTESQTTVSDSERSRNIHGAFRATPQAVHAHSKNIILIDDVITTGSTITEAAQALAPFKPHSLHAAAICRGQ